MAETAWVKRRRGRPPIDVDPAAVLAAAADAFAADGPDGARMEEIAAACGMTKALLYDRFGTKTQLLDAVLERESELLLRTLTAAYEVARETPRAHDAMRVGIGAFLDQARARPAGFALLFDEPRLRSSLVVRRTLRAIGERVTRLVAEPLERLGGASHADAEVVAAVIVGACTHLGPRLLHEPDWDHEQVVELTAQFAAAGLVNVGRGR